MDHATGPAGRSSAPIGAPAASLEAHADRLLDALTARLDADDRSTVDCHDVIRVIDATLRRLHRLRGRAVIEHRLRFDGAMARSAALIDAYGALRSA